MSFKDKLKKFFKGKYKIAITCSNCKKTNSVSIEKGTTILQYKKIGRCDYCGCRYEYNLANALEDCK